MSSPDTVALLPHPKSPSSDEEDGDEEIEYEEIEEEIEVEEEFEEEVEEDEIGEDLKPVRQENQGNEEEVEQEAEKEAGEDDKDEIGEDLTPVHSENYENDTSQDMELEQPEESKPLGTDTKGLPCLNSSLDNPSKQQKDGDLKTSESSEKAGLHLTGERTSGDIGRKVAINDDWEMKFARKIPFAANVDAAMATADGSCERNDTGVSVKLETNNSVVEPVSSMRQISPRLHIPQIRLRDPSSSAEVDGPENKKMRIVCQYHAKGWCIKGKSCRFLHIRNGSHAAMDKYEYVEREAMSGACTPFQQSVESQNLNCKMEKLVFHQDVASGNISPPAGRGYFGHNLYNDNMSSYASSFVSNSIIEKYGAHHEKFFGFSASGMMLDEMIISKKGEVGHNNCKYMKLPYSYSRQPVPIGASSWNTDTLGSQNPLENRLEHLGPVSSSWQRSISQISGSESDGLWQNHVTGDAKLTKYKTGLPSYKWEPSVAFRPSHVITRRLLIKEGLYDPVCNKIEQKNVRDGLLKFSYLSQGSSVEIVHKQSNCLQEEMALKSVHEVDTAKDNMLSSSSENKIKFDLPRHKVELKVDGCGKHDVTEVDFKREGHIQNEAKALKCFQAALIESVKELVKPTWRQGLLSKDAHKLIVKKAVDKVISTLHPSQIPSTGESIKLYLSSSQVKLLKLVEGYVDKYGKS